MLLLDEKKPMVRGRYAPGSHSEFVSGIIRAGMSLCGFQRDRWNWQSQQQDRYAGNSALALGHQWEWHSPESSIRGDRRLVAEDYYRVRAEKEA